MSESVVVGRIMQRGVLTCEPGTPLCEAAARMTKRRCSSIVIMRGGEALGIWTEHDALAADFSDPKTLRRPIAEVMSSPVAWVSCAAPLAEVALRMQVEQRRHFVVKDEAGQVCGIVSQTDVALNQGIEPYLRLREVRAAMRAQPLILEGTLLLAEAAEYMRAHGSDAVIVRGDEGFLGIITERDMVRFVARHPGNTPIVRVANSPLLSIGAGDTLIRARDLLLDNRVRHLAVSNDQGEIVGLLGFRDMVAGVEYLYLEDLRHALEQRDRALTQSRQNLELAERVIEASLEAIIITDADNRIEFVNPAFTQVTGYSAEEALGRTPALLSSGRHGPEFYQNMWAALRGHGYWRGEIWNRRKSGQLYLELLTITAIRDEKGVVSHYAALFTDITDIRENEERVRRLAYYDALTGLPNRRLLEDRLSLAIRHARRNERRLALIFIDLDHFKQVNDSLGHGAGDELLLRVSRRLQEGLRDDDTLARLGGDEFLVLLPDLAEIDEATRIARRLLEAVGEPFLLEGQQFRIGCSMGVSIYPDDGTSAKTLIHNADAAMYRAKDEGRNSYRLYRADLHVRDHQRLALESALRDTVETGNGLEIHFQPVVTMNGELHGAEALLRWTHPQFGRVSPSEFIPLAERSGLIVPLGARVRNDVARYVREWMDAGLCPPRVGINLAAAEFWQEGFVESVCTVFDHWKLPSGQIGFELTESALFERRHKGIAILDALRALGCWIAIDDFGTGYSSLSYLQELPVDLIKIDRSFIQRLDVEGARGNAAIVAAVTGLARELKLKVVAEGVESRAQHEALARYPVDFLQGYLFGRALPAAEFAQKWLRRQA